VVTHRTRSWCGRMTRASSLALITALMALPAAAADTPTKAPAPTLKASMQHIVARDVAAKPAVTVAARADRQTAPAGSTPGFFRSGPGMMAIAVMAAGTGYALYSASHDRIHSPGKK
jgi:outer membrane receptor protein involved in Fe transport